MLTANVIFCTLASAGGAVLKKTSHIDDLIVDEAAATTEPELCIPFHLRPKRLLAVGDPLQLPATVLSRRAMDLGLDKSLHERLMYDCDFEHVMLNVQYRMNSQISAFPSARFYNSKIDNGSNVAGPLYLNGARLLDRLPYSFLQVEGTEEQGFGGSFCNKSEAKKVVDVIVQLQQMAQDASWSSAERIRVITFYQAQVSLIKKYLHDRGFGNKIVVATVDSSQGSEADVVILSFVRSPKIISEHQHGRRPNSNPRSSAGFLSDDRRMNVALTRAKYQLICVGNVHGFSRLALNCTNNENTTSTTTLCELALDAEQREVIRTPLLSSVDNVNERLDIFYGMTSSAQASKRVFS